MSTIVNTILVTYTGHNKTSEHAWDYLQRTVSARFSFSYCLPFPSSMLFSIIPLLWSYSNMLKAFYRWQNITRIFIVAFYLVFNKQLFKVIFSKVFYTIFVIVVFTVV